ncbi:MAG TPA: transcriptional repressor LexA [Xanthomonadaceae bacterium]|nr:transcriptional repressor LexA [Xanthomonadaceae bacterium]
MVSELTPRQAEILAFLRRRIAEDGMPPTRAEIARAFGFRVAASAEEHLRALERKRAIELVPGSARGIRIPEEAGLPLIGRVAAGSPILAEQNIERHVSLDPGLFRPRPDYLLKVQGLSMRDAGILDGDLLAVARSPEARHGQIVVARLDDEVTVKRFERRGRRVRLLPANPDFSPIEVDLARQPLAIEGVAVGVLRSLGS